MQLNLHIVLISDMMGIDTQFIPASAHSLDFPLLPLSGTILFVESLVNSLFDASSEQKQA